VRTRGGQTWISACPNPAGFEKSGRVAKGRAGLPSGTAPASARRFLHTRRFFQWPPGRLGTRRAGLEPASPSLLVSRRQMAIRRCGLICLLGNSICKSNSNWGFNRQIKSPFAYDLTGASGRRFPNQPAGFRVDPAGISLPAGFSNTRRVWRNRRAKTGAVSSGKPARPFATRPDISNPAGHGRAEIHFCPPLVRTVDGCLLYSSYPSSRKSTTCAKFKSGARNRNSFPYKQNIWPDCFRIARLQSSVVCILR